MTDMIVKITRLSHPKLYHFLEKAIKNMGNDKYRCGRVKGEEAWWVYDVHGGEVDLHECQLAKMTDNEADRVALGDIAGVSDLVEKYHLQDFVNWFGDFQSGWFGSRAIAGAQ